MNALIYVDIDQSIHKVKMKVAQNEKPKKLLGFSFCINMGNFEAFLRNLNLSASRLFWRCGIRSLFIFKLGIHTLNSEQGALYCTVSWDQTHHQLKHFW